MLKLLFGSKKLFMRQTSDLNNETNNIINKKIDEENIIENNSMNKQFINDNNPRKKNFTVEIKKHHSPPTLRTPILLPKIKIFSKKKILKKNSIFQKLKPLDCSIYPLLN